MISEALRRMTQGMKKPPKHPWHLKLPPENANRLVFDLISARQSAIQTLCETIRAEHGDLLKEIDAIQEDIEGVLGLCVGKTGRRRDFVTYEEYEKRARDYILWIINRGFYAPSYRLPSIDKDTKTMLDAIKNT